MTVVARRTYASPGEAARLAAAVGADNPGYVRVTVEGARLEIGVTAPSAASARATLEDLLGCLAAAERAAVA